MNKYPKCYYFIVPKNKVTNEMINYSTSLDLGSSNKVKIPFMKFFKRECVILKVTEGDFLRSTCFDHLKAYLVDEILQVLNNQTR